MYYIQNSRREFEVSTSRKEDKRKKPKKISFYRSNKKRRKERKKLKKVGFYYMNLYFRGIVSLRKRINDFSQLQQLHKSQTPILALLRGKTTNKEREKENRTSLETLSHRRKKNRDWLFIKRKEKKRKFLGTWSLRK